MAKRLTIVGGGIAGLSAAYSAVKMLGGGEDITVLESGETWGGKIVTNQVEGFVIEGGPDTFVVTKPWGMRLCQELGIDQRLKGTNPIQKNTYILHNQRLHPLPGGLTMMIPTEFGPMLRSNLLSWPAKLRMGMDVLIPAQKTNGDESMGDFVTRRLGRQAYERLVEPLMSGIYAGDGDQLSIRATLPMLREMEFEHGGLVKGALALRRRRSKNGKTSSGAASIFTTPQNGLGEITDALVNSLHKAGVNLHSNSPAQSVRQVNNSFAIGLVNGQAIQTGHLILATPAFVSGQLVTDFAPKLAMELEGIDYVTTSTVSLAFRDNDLVRPLDGYGYVIPRRENRSALACTWTSTKFPHRAPEGYALLRVFIGRAGQEKDIDWNENALLALARKEIALTLGIIAQPVVSRVFIWEKAMPQYNVGHLARLERIETELDKFPSLALAGNGYQGIGIPDCIHSGELAVERLLNGAARSLSPETTKLTHNQTIQY